MNYSINANVLSITLLFSRLSDKLNLNKLGIYHKVTIVKEHSMTSKIDVNVLSITLLSFKPNASNSKEIRRAACTLQWLLAALVCLASPVASLG